MNDFIATVAPASRKVLGATGKSTAAAGLVVSALVVAAVASIGYYQVEIAPHVFTSASSTSATTTGLPPAGHYVNVTIYGGAGTSGFGFTGRGGKNVTGVGYVVVVVLGKNSTVVWINTDSVAHTVTSTTGVFDSLNQYPGTTFVTGDIFMYNFTSPGTYPYVCDFHPNMHGEVIVKP